MLAVVGGASRAACLARWGSSALGRLAALYLPRAGEIELSLPVLGFTAFLILLTGIGLRSHPGAAGVSRPISSACMKDAGAR